MSHKLFLADDSVTIQRVIELTFSGEDVQVLAVGDGEQAIERIPAERPDIVLADIGMPKRNGYEVAAFVKGHPDLKHIPVLLLAGAFEPVDDARAREVGCDGVLVKPFEPQQVVAKVRALLDGVKAEVASAPPPRTAVVTPFHAPARPAESQKRDEPKGGVIPELERPPLPAPGPRAVPPVTRGMTPDESLDDYFDRLDAAFSSLEAASIAAPPRPRDAAPADDALAVPTLEDILSGAGSKPPPPIDLPAHIAAPPVEPPDVTATIAPGAAPVSLAQDVTPDSPARNILADAFSLLLAAEQDEPGAQRVRLTTEPRDLVVTDALIDEVTRRVLQRVGPDAVRGVVSDIVSAVAERLVREEIERIRTKQ